MSIAIMSLLACIVLIVFAIVPKGLMLTEIVFLYFIIAILTITIFTILDVNLHWVPLTRTVEGSFAMYICRFIVIPFQILLSICILCSSWKIKWRLLFSGIIVLFLCLEDRIYIWADLLAFENWNQLYSALLYVISIVLVWWIARWFIGLDKGELEEK
ncbi:MULTISPECIES: hypothetical protein [Niallia]|jgi:hypothetical protein|uniref:Uncharacterized protein n=1 Tax=Niallia circulans TaxID=1397 RepID=A0A268FAN6_NIACI|nr:hypothetical protein [Niallia circulans]AYV68956.1 hypothetical protein C2I06_20040 [Niallia circulans]AYV72652.1 hypothetical protein C2H98_14320 [Niallia circulans]NRG27107.1 hypothetical protein [Niallia circulans]PAD82427.1 hypothetical protein CHH57_14850 [Niallia circulans]UQZ75024.1 hypothetical protein C2I17_10895 [Niallia circulans]